MNKPQARDGFYGDFGSVMNVFEADDISNTQYTEHTHLNHELFCDWTKFS